MILTDYYSFEKTDGTAGRMDCVASTGSYPDFEEKRTRRLKKHLIDGTEQTAPAGELKIYVGRNPHLRDAKRDPGIAITLKSRRLSGIFTPDVTLPYGYGDVRGTKDAVLFTVGDLKIEDGRVLPGSRLEIFVARGQSKNREALYNLLSDGDLLDEMNQLREEAEQER